MSSEMNRELARQFFLACDRLRGGPDLSLCHAEYRGFIGGSGAVSVDGHAQFNAAFYTAFPDLEHDIDAVTADETSAAVRFRLTGTQIGPMPGIPASGRPVEVRGMAMLQFEDGKVRETRVLFDEMTLMRQIGAKGFG